MDCTVNGKSMTVDPGPVTHVAYGWATHVVAAAAVAAVAKLAHRR